MGGRAFFFFFFSGAREGGQEVFAAESAGGWRYKAMSESLKRRRWDGGDIILISLTKERRNEKLQIQHIVCRVGLGVKSEKTSSVPGSSRCCLLL